MKHWIYICFFFGMSFTLLSQQKRVQSFSSNAKLIDINTEGLDEITIVNSESEYIEVSLFDENPNTHHILIDDETSILKIGFKLAFIEEDKVFRKYITKRLNRASAIIKLPKDKELNIFGNNIDVVSKDYKGDLNIAIDKGFVNLNKVQKSVDIKLFQGNIHATVLDSNIDVNSTNGKIEVDDEKFSKQHKKQATLSTTTFKVSSINANVVLKTFITE